MIACDDGEIKVNLRPMCGKTKVQTKFKMSKGIELQLSIKRKGG